MLATSLLEIEQLRQLDSLASRRGGAYPGLVSDAQLSLAYVTAQ